MGIKSLPIIQLSFTVLFFLLTSCSDDDTKTNPTTEKTNLTSESAQAILINSAEQLTINNSVQQNQGLMEAINGSAALLAGIPDLVIDLNSIVMTLSGVQQCAGSTGTVVQNGNEIVFTNFCFPTGQMGDGITINGSLSISVTNRILNILLEGFSIEYMGETHALDLWVEFDLDKLEIISTSPNKFLIDGETITLSGVDITGNGTDGYNIESGSLSGPFGTIDISTTAPVKFSSSCTTAKPTEGEIKIVGSNSSTATITFLSCTSYKICVNDVDCTEDNWPTTN